MDILYMYINIFMHVGIDQLRKIQKDNSEKDRNHMNVDKQYNLKLVKFCVGDWYNPLKPCARLGHVGGATLGQAGCSSQVSIGPQPENPVS